MAKKKQKAKTRNFSVTPEKHREMMVTVAEARTKAEAERVAHLIEELEKNGAHVQTLALGEPVPLWDNSAVIEEELQTTSNEAPLPTEAAPETNRKRPSEPVVAQAIGKIALANEMLDDAKARLEETVQEAREQKVPWAKIGEALGISDTAAHVRFTAKGKEANRKAQERYRNKK